MHETITLRDATTGATARILPGRGFNCYNFQPLLDGEPVEVLWAAADFVTGQAKASHSGIPVLFPFPGRLRGTSFTFRGRSFPLEAGDGQGNAIHGFVIDRPWRVVDTTETRVVGEFHASIDAPELLNHWPGDFRIAIAYELVGHALVSDVRIDNPGAGPLPFGFGTHPYFRVPLGPRGTADRCVVTVPAAEYWELAKLLPTGEKLPAVGVRGLADGLPFAETKLDDVFTTLRYVAGRASATIDDAASRRRLELSFDDAFRECVVYNPPHREAICIEPYTCVPDACALAVRGIETGLRVLEPGEQFATRIDLRVGLRV
ncbi:MAG: aldose 1-epimerase [Planctomycetia bacterium]|nr:aldose 1-epimerase [Planctomycetia bacterium]